MPAIPEPNVNTTKVRIFESYVEREKRAPLRYHLGASLIGRECRRQLWYQFRWARWGWKEFDGRMLRLFQSGHLQEVRVAEDMRAAGVTVHTHTPEGKQFGRYILGGHFGGSCDGFVQGLVEAPKPWHVWECKTHNDDSFKKLMDKGTKESKFEHWAQSQVYMGMWNLHDTFYTAVNKNTDDIYTERWKYDKLAYDEMVIKAKGIIFSDTPPSRPYRDSTYYRCKMCTYKGMCWGTDVPEVTCRSCSHSTPLREEQGGGWSCARANGAKIPNEVQPVGCGQHRYIPILLENFATPVNASNEQNWIQYQMKPHLPDGTPTGGGRFVNGPTPGLSSQEIEATAQKHLLDHPAIEAMKAEFPNARLTA